MFKALLRSQLQALYAMWFRSSGKGKKRGTAFKVLIGIFVIYIIGCFFMMFGWMFSALCRPLTEAGFGWLYFAVAAISAAGLCFIGSIFTAQQQLFSANDNDLLLSMPIPPAYILASRMVMLLILNYMFEILVMAPVGVVYCLTYTPSAEGVVFFVLCSLFMPFIVLALSCVFGWLLALIMDRIRNKSLVTTVFSLAFLAVYFYFYGHMNSFIAALIQNGAQIAEAIRRAVYPAYAFGMAVSEGSIADFIGFLLSCLVPFAVVYLILTFTFIKIVTTKHGAAKIKYRERALKTSTASAALLKKELRHFASNGMYILNAAMGSVFTLAAAVAIFVYRDLPALAAAQIPGIEPYFGAAVAAALCALASTDLISAPSISLEGKSLWIVKSLPVSAGQVLSAKAKAHMTVSLPPVFIASVSAIVALRLSPMAAAAALLSPVAMNVFCAYLGVVVNLHFPKFDFINEVAVIKQSLSVLITMIACMGVVVAPAALYIWLLKETVDASVFMLIFTAVLAAASFLMKRYLNRGGAERFLEL